MGSSKSQKNGRKKVGPDDLRRAPPVRRLVGQLQAIQATLTDRRETFESWADSLPKNSDSGQWIERGALHFANCIDSFEPIFETLGNLARAGFSPPRKCFTADTKVGDRISILEANRPTYTDFLPASKMSDLGVVKRYRGKGAAGKGGGLLVEDAEGNKLRVAAIHAVRLTA